MTPATRNGANCWPKPPKTSSKSEGGREAWERMTNARASSLRPCDGQYKASPERTPIWRPIQSWLQSFSFSFGQYKQSKREKRYPKYCQTDSQPEGEINKQLAGQCNSKDGLRNIGQVMGNELASSSISDSTFHFSIASPHRTVKNGAVSSA